MRGGRACRVAAVVSAAWLVSPRASGEAVDDATRSAARNLAGQAKAALAHGDYDRARDLFHRAYTLIPAPTIAVYEARALAKLRRFVEAEEAYMRAVRTSLDSESPDQFRKAARDAETELVALRPRIPKVTLVANGAGATAPDLNVSLDGKAVKNVVLGVEMPVDPGDHEVTAAAGAGQTVKVRFAIAEKEQKTVPFDVPPGIEAPALVAVAPNAARPPEAQPAPVVRADVQPDATPGSTQRLAGFIAGGVGIAGLGTGIVTGLMAAGKFSKAEKQCPERVCVEGTEGPDTLQSFRTLRTVSTVGYVTGGIGLAAGLTLLLTAPSARPAQATSFHLFTTGRTVGVEGAF